MVADSNSVAARRIGLVMSTLISIILLGDGLFSLFGRTFAPDTVRQMMELGGFCTEQAGVLGIITLTCAVLYAIPRTAVLGAILVSGFFGGAICAHFRLGEMGSPPQVASLILGAMAWGGLYLRNAQVRALLPFTS
jgi:hypothetical protein